MAYRGYNGWVGTITSGWIEFSRVLIVARPAIPPLSIHERSAREKISSDQVAHVLNDEVSRKYIQSLKR